MSPISDYFVPSRGLEKRDYYAGNGYYCDAFGNCERSRWYSWGRWVALIVIVGVFFLTLFSFGLFTARRRRARGLRPFYGTAWIAPKFAPSRTHQWHVPPQTNNNNNTYNQDAPAPPAYTPPVGGYFAPSPAHNGQAHNTQYEMQHPYPGENQQQQGGYGQPYVSPMSPVQQVNPNYTGQSNNPYFAAQVPPSSPPPAHLGGHGGKI